jgi:hypothetical protein
MCKMSKNGAANELVSTPAAMLTSQSRRSLAMHLSISKGKFAGYAADAGFPKINCSTFAIFVGSSFMIKVQVKTIMLL